MKYVVTAGERVMRSGNANRPDLQAGAGEVAWIWEGADGPIDDTRIRVVDGAFVADEGGVPAGTLRRAA